MNDELMQRLIRMSAEADALDQVGDRSRRRLDGCVGMAQLQSRADSADSLSSLEQDHIRACAVCGPRWKAMLASRPVPAQPTGPSRWYRYATGLTAAAACFAALFTISSRPSQPNATVSGRGPIASIATTETPVTAAATSLLICIPGDSNCDGVVDSSDLTALGFAVHRPEEYADRFPNCDAVCSNDVNGDSVVDECDQDDLVQCVGG